MTATGGNNGVQYLMAWAICCFMSPLARILIVEEKRSNASLRECSDRFGGGSGKTGSGFYVEARHPDFQLPFRKTYEWHQYSLASRDFDLLSAVVGAVREERTEALAG